MTDIFTPNVLVLLAGGSYIIGFLIINQVILRLFIFVGSLSYIGYYATVADEPLWGAIITTIVISAANVIGFMGLWAKNAAWRVPPDHRDIYARFLPILPGDFRALVKMADRFTLDQDTDLTTEGASVDRLYYVVSGIPHVTKGQAIFQMRPGIFVGEVAYLKGAPSAATTRLKAGDEVLAWDFETLERMAKRKPALKLALDAVISKDLANKVSLAVAPKSAEMFAKQ